MPEIWLNYGTTQAVLDVRAENLEQRIESEEKPMGDDAISERLGGLDLSRQADLVVLHNSKSIQKMITLLFAFCELKSLPKPNILADKKTAGAIRPGLPEGCSVGDFDSPGQSGSNPVFVGEVEFDGLFGYETVATRLTKKFGAEHMLSAYAKRKSNSPAPGQVTESLEEAKKFADGFDVRAIELVSNSSGIVDFAAGHPSQTLSAAKSLEATAIKDVEAPKSVIVSTGKDSSNNTLSRALSSLWNCHAAIKNGGLAILVAECMGGLGSESLQRHVEGRLSIDRLRAPPKYIDGMENLLYLHEVRQRLQVGLVSVLPEFYTKKLGIVSLPGVGQSMEYILKTLGPRQKVSVIPDGARILLR